MIVAVFCCACFLLLVVGVVVDGDDDDDDVVVAFVVACCMLNAIVNCLFHLCRLNQCSCSVDCLSLLLYFTFAVIFFSKTLLRGQT